LERGRGIKKKKHKIQEKKIPKEGGGRVASKTTNDLEKKGLRNQRRISYGLKERTRKAPVRTGT